jgi:hypothetical protein
MSNWNQCWVGIFMEPFLYRLVLILVSSNQLNKSNLVSTANKWMPCQQNFVITTNKWMPRQQNFVAMANKWLPCQQNSFSKTFDYRNLLMHLGNLHPQQAP